MAVERGAYLVDLANKDMNQLEGFRVCWMTEVYTVDTDGRKAKSIGFFHNDAVAQAFAGNQTDACFTKYSREFVLTDGKVGFVIAQSVTLLDDEEEALKIKQAVLARLSEAERKVLGL
jgi:hypothetical protein